MEELEVRIINIDIEHIRNTMLALKAEKVKEEQQKNHIFDFPDKRLLEHKGYARVREVVDLLRGENKCYMTTKRMLSQEKYKIMEEHEVEVSCASEAMAIYEALGLVKLDSIGKYRESYSYKHSLVEIDINDKSFCPFPYVEIETSSEEELQEIVKLLGYSMEDTTSKTIYEILKAPGRISGL